MIILLRFYLLKTFIYEFVNCKAKSKPIYVLVLIKLSLLWATVQTYTRYNNNYNYKCLSDTTIRYFAYNIFVSHTKLRYSNTQPISRLLELQLIHFIALFSPFVDQ